MWFVQRAHLHLVRRAGLLDSQIALGAWPFPEVSDASVVAEIPYCDNITCIGQDAAAVTRTRDTVLEVFRAAGFAMHEISGTESASRVPGADLGGSPARVRRFVPKL